MFFDTGATSVGCGVSQAARLARSGIRRDVRHLIETLPFIAGDQPLAKSNQITPVDDARQQKGQTIIC
jgi:hypothetical protein